MRLHKDLFNRSVDHYKDEASSNFNLESMASFHCNCNCNASVNFYACSGGHLRRRIPVQGIQQAPAQDRAAAGRRGKTVFCSSGYNQRSTSKSSLIYRGLSFDFNQFDTHQVIENGSNCHSDSSYQGSATGKRYGTGPSAARCA